MRGDDAFMELAKDPMIVDCVEQLIGPDIILWGCQLFCKPGTDWDGGADAPRRRLLADSSFGNLHGVGRFGSRVRGERLYASSAGFTSSSIAVTSKGIPEDFGTQPTCK